MDATQVLKGIWQQAGMPPEALDAVRLTGADPVLPSSFAVGTAAQATIAAAEHAAAEARDRHSEVARRTDQLRTRLAGIEQAVAEIVGDIADAEMRRTFRQARLSSISDTQADREAANTLRARIAELRAALVEAEATCTRLARESEMRVERLGRIDRCRRGGYQVRVRAMLPKLRGADGGHGQDREAGGADEAMARGA